MPKDDQRHDPMRELDLLLLEDLMMRRNFQPTKAAIALQITSMFLVLLGVGFMFVYAVQHPEVGRDPGGHASLNTPVP